MIFPQSLFGVKKIEGVKFRMVICNNKIVPLIDGVYIHNDFQYLFAKDIKKVESTLLGYHDRIRRIINKDDVIEICGVINKNGVYVYYFRDNSGIDDVSYKFNRIFDFGFNWCPVVVPYSQFDSYEDLYAACEEVFSKNKSSVILFHDLSYNKVYTIRRFGCKRLFYYYKARLSKFKDYLFKTDKH